MNGPEPKRRMTGPEHYDEAQQLMAEARGLVRRQRVSVLDFQALCAQAQVHATLSQAAATMDAGWLASAASEGRDHGLVGRPWLAVQQPATTDESAQCGETPETVAALRAEVERLHADVALAQESATRWQSEADEAGRVAVEQGDPAAGLENELVGTRDELRDARREVEQLQHQLARTNSDRATWITRAIEAEHDLEAERQAHAGTREALGLVQDARTRLEHEVDV